MTGSTVETPRTRLLSVLRKAAEDRGLSKFVDREMKDLEDLLDREPVDDEEINMVITMVENEISKTDESMILPGNYAPRKYRIQPAVVIETYVGEGPGRHDNRPTFSHPKSARRAPRK